MPRHVAQRQEDGSRSGFESRVRSRLVAAGADFEYESVRLGYKVEHSYTPDFKVRTRSGKTIFVEAKGYFKPEDRTKMLLVRDQNYPVDIRFVFQRADTPLRKGSRTTYAKWCDNAGFRWAEREVPQEWLDE